MWRQRLCDVEEKLRSLERGEKRREEKIKVFEREGKVKEKKIRILEKRLRDKELRVLLLEKRLDAMDQGEVEERKGIRKIERRVSWRAREEEREWIEERARKTRREESRERQRQEVTEEGKEKKIETLKERGLLVKKGRANRGEGLSNWIAQMLESEVILEKELGEGEESGWIVFKEKRDRDGLFELEGLAREEGIFLVNEWLSMEERSDRFKLMNAAKEIEREARRTGKEIYIIKDNRFIRVEGKKYVWNRKENRLVREAVKIDWELGE